MKLWELRPTGNIGTHGDPWYPWYDCVFAFVIRAETEALARQIAQEHGGDEVRLDPETGERSATEPWLNPARTSCVELTAEGEPGVVIEDALAG